MFPPDPLASMRLDLMNYGFGITGASGAQVTAFQAQP